MTAPAEWAGREHDLRGHPDFMRLWLGQTVSQLGSLITRDALPLMAVLTLRASPAQMGLLAAAGTAPVVAVGLLAGVWVDRLRRRPIMIAADWGRALLLLTIPAAAAFGVLRIEQMYIVALLVGGLSVFFDVAYRSYLPALVQRERIVEGNSRLSASESAAEIVGPALGGGLVQWVGGPLTVLLDALSFAVSAVSLGSIRTPEPPPNPVRQRMNAWREIREGLGSVGGHPLLMALAGSEGVSRFFGGFFGALYGLYAIRGLGFSPAVVGLLIGAGGLGALIGSLSAERITRRSGVGTTLTISLALTVGFSLLVPLAGELKSAALALMLAAQLCGDTARAVYSIGELSLRQAVTPDGSLGRVNATWHVLGGGAGTLGLLVGGALGGVIGVNRTLWIAATGGLFTWAWVFFSPVRRLPAQSVNE